MNTRQVEIFCCSPDWESDQKMGPGVGEEKMNMVYWRPKFLYVEYKINVHESHEYELSI